MNNLILKLLLSAMMVSLSALNIMVSTASEAEFIHEEKVVAVEVNNTVHIEQSETVAVAEKIQDYEILKEELKRRLEDINRTYSKKEWFLAYKDIIDEYGDVLDFSETIYDLFTEEELDLLFRVVQAEIGDEHSFEQKVNVACVIFNRWKHDQFQDTLAEILIPSQFSVISNGRYKKVEISEETILACEYAFSIDDTTGGCLFFDSNNKLKYEFVFSDGAHNFYKLKENIEKGSD